MGRGTCYGLYPMHPQKDYQHSRQNFTAVGAVPISDHSLDFIRFFDYNTLNAIHV